MSESNTAVADAPVDVVAPADETSTPVVEIPPAANDAKVKTADAMALAAELLKLSNSSPTQREELENRALQLWVRHLAVKVNEPIEMRKVELPAYKSELNAEGVRTSFRYTKERAQLLFAIADANSAAAHLAYDRYTYPNPSTSRRRHYAILWGTPADLDATLSLFGEYQARALTDAYKITFEPNTPPAKQTTIRRQWMRDFASTVDRTLEAVRTAKTTATKLLADRSNAAEEARVAWSNENAAQGDAAVQTESVHA